MWLDGLAAADSSLCVRLSSPLSLLWCGRVPETHPTRCPRPSVVLQRALTAHPSVSPLTCQGLAQGAPRQWGAERGVWSVGRLPTQTSEAPADSTPPSLSSSSPRQVPPGSFLQVAPSFSLLGHQSLGTWWPFGVVLTLPPVSPSFFSDWPWLVSPEVNLQISSPLNLSHGLPPDNHIPQHSHWVAPQRSLIPTPTDAGSCLEEMREGKKGRDPRLRD